MSSRLCCLAVSALLLLSACGSAGPSGGPSSSPASSLAANACATGSGSAEPLTSPGWPGSPDVQDPVELVPVAVSPELAVGPNRFQFTLLDAQNRLVAARDVTAEISFFDLAAAPETPISSSTATYVETPDERGLYVAHVDFRCSGDWGAEVTARIPDREDRLARILFPVLPDSSTPSIGDTVPSTDTPTATTPQEIAAISTDTDPDPDLYRVSESDALAAGDPFVLIFSTPAFCRTATCGPTLDVIKAAATDYKDRLTFIHVEPYKLEQRNGQLQPVLDPSGGLQVIDQVTAWGLPAEPFIFVVGSDGRLSAKFAGLVGEDELRAAFEAVTAS